MNIPIHYWDLICQCKLPMIYQYNSMYSYYIYNSQPPHYFASLIFKAIDIEP